MRVITPNIDGPPRHKQHPENRFWGKQKESQKFSFRADFHFRFSRRIWRNFPKTSSKSNCTHIQLLFIGPLSDCRASCVHKFIFYYFSPRSTAKNIWRMRVTSEWDENRRVVWKFSQMGFLCNPLAVCWFTRRISFNVICLAQYKCMHAQLFKRDLVYLSDKNENIAQYACFRRRINLLSEKYSEACAIVPNELMGSLPVYEMFEQSK